MPLTLDASVLISAYSPAELEHANSRLLIDRLFAARTTLVQPTLFAVEIAAAIARARDDPSLARDLVNALLQLPFIHWIALDQTLGRRAMELAIDHKLRGADAIYAAVALSRGCQLITLDREHLTRLTAVLTTLTPAQAIARPDTP